MKPAILFRPLKGDQVQCRVCSHFCRIDPGERGICGVRENRGGKLFTLVYDKVVAAAVDPIEKKPIFHLRPGSTSFSIATVGCNLKCRFCQNADIAQWPVTGHGPQTKDFPGRPATPETIVASAKDAGCESVSFTYTEPTIYTELALETAELARQEGLHTVFVTNGFMSPDFIEMVAPVLSAANVDLKAFSEDFYRTFCKARLAPVKQNLKHLVKAGVMVEVTTLVIPGLNDDLNELSDMAAFIAGELGPHTPWHLSRFHPAHDLTDRGPTPAATLDAACEKGLAKGLHHVYTGNLAGGREDTVCHDCGTTLVSRRGYQARSRITEKGACPDCSARVHGIF